MKQIIAALGKFQRECPVMTRDSDGYKYKYATLDQIKTTINPLLEKHNLVFSQPLEVVEGVRYLVTHLWHLDSGEELKSRLDVPEYPLMGMNGYQTLGAAITYLRRYELGALLGIVIEEDNDAQGKPDVTKPKDKQPVKKPTADAPAPNQGKGDKDHTPEGNPKKWLNRERPKGSGTITDDWANAVAYLRGDIPREDGQEPKIADLESRYKISKAGREQLMTDTLDLNFLKPKDGEDLPDGGPPQAEIPY